MGYDNGIYYDHVKPVNILSCFTLNFHNARAGAAIQRGLGVGLPIVIGEGWYNLARRPRELWRAVHRRRHELPVGTLWRLHIVGLSFCLGTIIGALFGAGRSAHKID